MINQEDVYNWLTEKQYGKVTDLLHQQKETIKSDQLLTHAAKISVTEILRVAKEENNPSADFIYNLERLNLIHAGNFFQMEEEQHKELI